MDRSGAHKKILAVSDVEVDSFYSEQAADRFSDVDLIVSCGDLPVSYLDFLSSTLNVPLYYVDGNHKYSIETKYDRNHFSNCGGLNLHCAHRTFEKQLLFAGVEGCHRYNRKPKQYTQSEMWGHVFSLVPRLFFNRIWYGRYLDFFVTHAPPWKIHDEEDLAHIGIRAFRWLDKVFKPGWHLHGHIHVYRQDTITETVYYNTKVVNCYGSRVITAAKCETDGKEI